MNIAEDSIRSKKIPERLSFKLEGILRDVDFRDGKFESEALLRESDSKSTFEEGLMIKWLEEDLKMEIIKYRKLELSECEKINEINAAQYIGRAWREVDGKRQLVEINYQDPDWPEGYENHLNSLKETLNDGGSAFGAFDIDGKLVGFATLNRQVFGIKYDYVLLDQIFITLEKRNCGIGKKLFMLTAQKAKEWDADKIYICAGSAEETIAFYKKIGCTEAEEVQAELYESDPRDLQLEFALNNVRL